MSTFLPSSICAIYYTLSDDPIFKAYRKEYKKRFAWIKAGRITDEQFYAWSEKAREEKKKCDREIISLEEFQQWLRDSKI